MCLNQSENKYKSRGFLSRRDIMLVENAYPSLLSRRDKMYSHIPSLRDGGIVWIVVFYQYIVPTGHYQLVFCIKFIS
jgi:hypothetical protein